LAIQPLGNLVADAHLAYAKKRGAVDIGMTNSGGIRADLTVEPGRTVTLSDLFAIQPFSNELIAHDDLPVRSCRS
jgi:5'-nucleotidase